MNNPQSRRGGLSRRGALAIGAGTAAVPALAACGDPGADPTLKQVDKADPGTFLAHAEDVPVGGCLVIPQAATVVTQPVEGEFKAFSGVCTHQRCFLASFSEGHIPCRCHGSRFDLADGSVLEGPATEALEEYEISVDGTSISLA